MFCSVCPTFGRLSLTVAPNTARMFRLGVQRQSATKGWRTERELRISCCCGCPDLRVLMLLNILNVSGGVAVHSETFGW